MKGSLTEHQAANKPNCVSALEFLKIAKQNITDNGKFCCIPLWPQQENRRE